VLISWFVETRGKGFMRKRSVYLLIGFLVTLMFLGLASVPRVFSQTESVKILSHTYYVDNAGFLDVVGEVQNVGSNTVDPVVLTGTVYATDGSYLGRSYCYVWVKYFSPGQKAPFYMEFQPPQNSNFWQPSEIGNFTLTVAQANATSSYMYPDLKISSSQASIGTSQGYNGAYIVNGVIQNTGSQTATNLTIVATFFNAAGTVVAVGNTYGSANTFVTPSLSPSGTVQFQVAAWDLNQSIVPTNEKISSYSLLIQTQGPILQGTAPIVTPYQGSGSFSSSTPATNSPSPTSTAPNSNNSSVNTNANSSSIPVTSIAIIIVIIVVAVAGTFIAVRRVKPHQTVKEQKKAKKNRR